MKSIRLKEMEDYIIKQESVSLDNLCSMFKVSKNTIRKDVEELDRKGVIKKVYGGVTINPKKVLVPFKKREEKNKAEKQIIGKLAGDLVCDSDIIFIDTGTTAIKIIPYIANKKNITIITNSVNALVVSQQYNNLNVISTGGTLYRSTGSFIGTEAVESLKMYNISKAFVATNGITIDKGLTDSLPLEYQIKKFVSENSDTVILMADNSKINKVSLLTYCNLEDIDIFVTDKTPPEEFVEFFKKNNIKLILPDNKKA